jgi:hypothetical protein
MILGLKIIEALQRRSAALADRIERIENELETADPRDVCSDWYGFVKEYRYRKLECDQTIKMAALLAEDHAESLESSFFGTS